MRSVTASISRHWGKLVVVVALIAGGIAYAASAEIRTKTHDAWRAALTWAGIGAASTDSGKVYWCPMHPQIKSHKENSVCPICNMALVELEGGVAEAPEHLTLTAQQIQQAGVATEPVLRRRLDRALDTTGRIDYDERKLAKIASWIKGRNRIEKLYVNFMGQQVEKGEPLVELYSPALITSQQAYLSELALNSSQEREDSLLPSAQENLKNLGLTPSQIDHLATTREIQYRIPITAPISGTVIHRNVQEGQYVSEGDVLFEIADLSTLWLFADVFEDELPLVKVGTPVELSVSAFPGETFAGQVAFREPKVRPATRTVPVRIDVDNRDGKLMPGMFARVQIQHEFPATLAVPENAVLWSGERSVVILRQGDGAFRPTEIRTGQKWLQEADTKQQSDLGFGDGKLRYHEVLDGLAPGDEVVTSGAFLLNAESQFQSVLTKMLPPASQRATLKQVLGEPAASRLRQVLDAYFQLSAALADDKIGDANNRLGALAAAARSLADTASTDGNGQLSADANKFAVLTTELSRDHVKDAVDARTRFGRISYELTKLLADHGGKTLFGDELFHFECGMAKVGYERWLWWSPEIHNPYMGQRMLKCGTKLDVLEP